MVRRAAVLLSVLCAVLLWASVERPPAIVAETESLGLVATFPATGLPAAADAGLYRPTMYGNVTTSPAGPCSGTGNLSWTYNGSVKTVILAPAIDLTFPSSFTVSTCSRPIRVDAGTAVNVDFTVAGAGCAGLVYDLYVTTERLQ